MNALSPCEGLFEVFSISFKVHWVCCDLETPKFLSLSGYATGSQELLIKTSIEESPNANKVRMIKSL